MQNKMLEFKTQSKGLDNHCKTSYESGFHKELTADEPIDSRWDIGSPTYLTAFLK